MQLETSRRRDGCARCDLRKGCRSWRDRKDRRTADRWRSMRFCSLGLCAPQLAYRSVV